MEVNFYKKHSTLVDNYMEAQFFFQILELGIFDYLDFKISIEDLAAQINCKSTKLQYVLNILLDREYIKFSDNKYVNSAITSKFLSRNSKSYIGNVLKSKRDMLDLSNMKELLGSNADGNIGYDFAKLAESSKVEMECFRVKRFAENLKNEFFSDDMLKIIDIGGGAGYLAREAALNCRNSEVYLLDRADIIEVAKKVEGMSQLGNIVFLKGDFLTDDFGGDYDLIIASGIIDFACNALEEFILKLSNALKVGGKIFFYQIIFNIDESNRLKWLKGSLRNNHVSVVLKDFESVVEKANLIFCKEDLEGVYPLRIYEKR